MAQNFTAIPATTQLKDSLSPLLDRDEAVASAFSGTAFPVTSLYVGMTCHRTDQGKRYVLIDLTPTWIEILSFDPVTGLAVAPRAARLATPRAISITGDVTAAGVDFDGTGPVALTATVVQASATVAGKVELATSAETATGTDTVRAVTPAGLKSVTDTLAPRANPTFTGTVTLPADAIVASNIASNAVTATKIASNAVITAKITDAAVTTSKIADGAVTQAKLGQIVFGSAVTLTGGAVDITGIPANANTVFLAIEDLDRASATYPFVQLGAGTIETTDYSCVSSVIFGSSPVTLPSTTGLVLPSNSNGSPLSAVITFQRIAGNRWIASGTGHARVSSAQSMTMSGIKNLSGALDRLRISGGGSNLTGTAYVKWSSL